MRMITACAGGGALVGAAVLLTVRFVTGSSVDGAVAQRLGIEGPTLAGDPRRYVDYLGTSDTGGPVSRALDTGALWPVVIATGVVAGLLIGVVAQLVLRPGRGHHHRSALAPVAGPVLGALVGLAVAVELHVYGSHGSADVGWYSYSPVGNDGILYGGGPDLLIGTSSPGALLVTGAVVGVVVGLVVSAAALALRRR